MLVELCILRIAVGTSPVASQPRPGGAASGVIAARGREAYGVSTGPGGFCCGGPRGGRRGKDRGQEYRGHQAYEAAHPGTEIAYLGPTGGP